MYHLYRLINESNQDSITTVHGRLLKLTQNLWYTWYKDRQTLQTTVNNWSVGVPHDVFTGGTMVVHPVHLPGTRLHILCTTTVLVRSMLHMVIVVHRADDSSRATKRRKVTMGDGGYLPREVRRGLCLPCLDSYVTYVRTQRIGLQIAHQSSEEI